MTGVILKMKNQWGFNMNYEVILFSKTGVVCNLQEKYACWLIGSYWTVSQQSVCSVMEKFWIISMKQNKS